ncbi:homocysteine S-methyltransferase family protein [Portibacter marinus]|uniref:homocysteine S-methyltransferase family protein n=1 Tax=Portibacter marinus TaxID=2898660 RepID=UPI003873381D
MIVQAHLDYIKAGARCITSASYQSSAEGFMKWGISEGDAEGLMCKSIKLCDEMARRYKKGRR